MARDASHNTKLTLNNTDFCKIGKHVIDIELKGVKELHHTIDQNFVQACKAILNCAGKVVVMGIGKSGHIGHKIAATLASTGTPAFFVHPAEAGHGDLGMITRQDIILILSNSGESNEILALLPIIKRQHIPIIAITSDTKSNLAKTADIHLCIQISEEACPLGLAPTTSTTAMLVLGDALAVSLLQAHGFTAEDFALSHPGGTLGRKLLLRVSDIMHAGKDIPCINLDASLAEALLEITSKKLGMTVVSHDKKHIDGIFTDGDLRRVFAMGIDLNNAKIADLMTPGGINIPADSLAVDALNLMEARNITSLIVVENQCLVGVIHMHDMLKAGVI